MIICPNPNPNPNPTPPPTPKPTPTPKPNLKKAVEERVAFANECLEKAYEKQPKYKPILFIFRPPNKSHITNRIQQWI